MPSYRVATPQRTYEAIIERGLLRRAGDYIPKRAGKLFVVTTEDVWRLHGHLLEAGLQGRHATPLFFPGGEDRKRIAQVEAMAEQMLEAGADRTSVVVAFG